MDCTNNTSSWRRVCNTISTSAGLIPLESSEYRIKYISWSIFHGLPLPLRPHGSLTAPQERLASLAERRAFERHNGDEMKRIASMMWELQVIYRERLSCSPARWKCWFITLLLLWWYCCCFGIIPIHPSIHPQHHKVRCSFIDPPWEKSTGNTAVWREINSKE